MAPIDIEHLRKIAGANNRYNQQLERLNQQGQQVSCIENAVNSASQKIFDNGIRSFIIYGEPQSGKTEMMICLTAKLIDSGFNVVIHLLNDSVQLLQQNLDRFQRSGLAPAAKNFSDLLDPAISLKTGQYVIFCKKNANDLRKLIEKTGGVKNKAIIDDEADFATPNAKINKGEITRINNLVSQLIGNDGIYIGVTATPARLDLNNTFDNDNENWVSFPPHEKYTGQDIFFPVNKDITYKLVLISEHGDDPKYLRDALFRFMVRVAYINLNSPKEENFSMLVHTSGKRIDHKADKKPIDDVFQGLSDTSSSKFAKYVQEIEVWATKLYGNNNAQRIVEYIVLHGTRCNAIVMNSDRDKNVDFKSATCPSSLFTVVKGRAVFIVGDNTIRGTFVQNSKIVSIIAELAGLKLKCRRSRSLPANRRYLPPPANTNSALALNTRMRREVILAFSRLAAA